MQNKIRLFWWSEMLLMGKPKENYGDLLGLYLVEKIASQKVEFANPKKWTIKDLWMPIYVTIGSILLHVNKKCIVWGSGIIRDNEQVKPARFLAVRGPETRRVLLNQGHKVPEVYGDPALLLPKYFSPKITKKYKLGIVPHYVDYQLISEMYKNDANIRIVDLMTTDIEYTTVQILECEKIVSSSLHGLILAHAYGLPAIWVRFSDKLFGDNIKFKDYFGSVNITNYDAPLLEHPHSQNQLEQLFDTAHVHVKRKRIESLQNGLLEVCPFKNEN